MVVDQRETMRLGVQPHVPMQPGEPPVVLVLEVRAVTVPHALHRKHVLACHLGVRCQ